MRLKEKLLRRRKEIMKDNLASSIIENLSVREPYAETQLPTQYGMLTCQVYRDDDGVEHVAMIAGDLTGDEPVLCRVHSACMTSEVFGSLKCDCKEQLTLAMDEIAKNKRGIVIYLQQEGRGIGLGNKIRAYALQEEGLDTVDANRSLGLPDDTRDYSMAADILSHLGVNHVALMTNNPEKINGLQQYGITVQSRVPHLPKVDTLARDYVRAKQERMGHLKEHRPELKVCAVNQ